MKYNILSVILLTFAMTSCGDKTDDKNLFSFNGEVLKAQYKPNETASFEILNPQNKVVDSVIYYVNDKNVGAVKGSTKLPYTLTGKFGYQNLKALVFFEGKNVETTERIELVSDVQPRLLTYKVLNVYPHDISSFTEGLEFFRDTLMESTGHKGDSYIRKLDYKTGKVFKQVDLSAQYFGEGMTVLNNQIFQLTYQEYTGFIYNANTMKLEKTFPYDKQIEGWGMTNDGKFIYHSDGTEKIWKMDPATQKMIDYVNVYSSENKIKSINELEYIDGKIYGNIWQKDAIAVINAETGAVEGVLNLNDLRKQLTNPQSEVLNGIAYNPKTKTIFVTGKHWDKLFEIKVSD